jgi:transcriptional regulator with XRE-family HTH domain
MAVPRGRVIEAIRVKRGEKRSDFARRVGISYKHLYGIENGHTTAARETLHRIADALVVDVAMVMEAEPKQDGAA